MTAVFVVMASSFPVHAEPTIRVVTKYYEISGTSVRALKKQMKRRGPNGYWAYTKWYVRWSSDCKVELKITYTYPKLRDPNSVPLPVRQKFQTMVEKLTLHEKGHGQHGIEAASEISAAHCKKAKKIIQKWAAQDKRYDAETRHGITQGVRLAD